ncbi:hypothetical protein COOONC_06588 [Cooperia oncophora]
MANKYKIHFAESSAAGDSRILSQLLHTTFQHVLTGARSPSPRLYSSDSGLSRLVSWVNRLSQQFARIVEPVKCDLKLRSRYHYTRHRV